MKLVQFKLLTIIIEPVLSAQILALSESMGATGFTITEVNGKGTGEKSTGEIPDSKIKIEIVLDPELANQLMKTLADQYFENYSLITYSTDVAILRPEKFENQKT